MEEEVDEELMAIFLEGVAQEREGLNQGLAGNDWGQVRAAAHSIKGSAASFGFPGLSEQAKKLQEAIDLDQFDQAPELASTLLSDLDKALSS